MIVKVSNQLEAESFSAVGGTEEGIKIPKKQLSGRETDSRPVLTGRLPMSGTPARVDKVKTGNRCAWLLASPRPPK